MQQPLKDFKGCLTDAGLAAFRAAAPGKAPAELAAHLAGCARCQERVLTSDEGTLGPGKRKAPPPLWRVLVIFFVGLIVAFAGFLARSTKGLGRHESLLSAGPGTTPEPSDGGGRVCGGPEAHPSEFRRPRRT